MTNIEYRRLRGTDKPFQGSLLAVHRRWYAMNKIEIDRRRARKGRPKWADSNRDWSDLHDEE